MQPRTLLEPSITSEQSAVALPEQPLLGQREVISLTLLVILAGVVIFTGLGSVPLFNPDEALYAEPAREMLENGDWMTTYLNYVVRFTKPPLCIWMMALSYQAFGMNEFAARFFGASCGVVLVAITYLFGRKFVSNTAAVLGTLTLLIAPLFVGIAREAITDMPLALFVAGALFAFHRSFTTQRASFRWLGYAALGIAVMIKGPVAVVVPGLILLAYHLLRGNLLEAIRFYKPLLGGLLVAAIALPWFIGEIVITKGAYFREFILRENVQRFTSLVDQHKGGWWYHIVAMMGGYFPWCVFLPQALAAALFPATPDNGLRKFHRLDEKQDAALFLSCMVLITLVFFSMSVSKLIPYTLPAFPALAVLVALEFDRILKHRSPLRILLPFAVLATVYGVAGVLAPTMFPKLKHVPASLFGVVNGYLSFQSLTLLAVIILAALKRYQAALVVFSAATIACSGYFALKALPIASQEFEGPIPSFSRFVGASAEPVFVYRIRKPSVPFYALRATALSPNQEFLTTTVEDELPKCSSAWIIAKDKDEKHLDKIVGCRVMCREGHYLLARYLHPAPSP
jgi:4-amino-4-deoxy-L-arabinose transferase-like glycosyltransferase